MPGGLPHSEIPGSTIARISPGLFAACHVLHRLSVPRHPPDALLMLLTPHPTANITDQTHGVWSNDAPGLTRGPSGARSRRCSRNACRGSVIAVQSPGAFLSIQKTLRDGTDRPREPHDGEPHDQGKPRPPLPSRSHNSLLHNCPSTTPRRSLKDGRGNSVICRDLWAGAARFRRNGVAPVARRLRSNRREWR